MDFQRYPPPPYFFAYLNKLSNVDLLSPKSLRYNVSTVTVTFRLSILESLFVCFFFCFLPNSALLCEIKHLLANDWTINHEWSPPSLNQILVRYCPLSKLLLKRLYLCILQKTLYQRKRNDLQAATFEVVHHDTCTKRHCQETNAVELVQNEALNFFFTLNFISFSK